MERSEIRGPRAIREAHPHCASLHAGYDYYQDAEARDKRGLSEK
jgi:hypothetical protein